MNIRDVLFDILQYAIKKKPLDREAVKAYLNGEKLSTLYKVAKKHDVAHLVAFALTENCISFEAEEWKLFLEEKEQASLRYEMLQADINEICACFDKNGIEYIPLKGAVLRQYYPQRWMRTSCDIDILVHDDDLSKAVDCLVKECSYTTDGKKTYHDISLYSPFGMHLELHHNIKETVDKYDKLLTQVWEFSKKTDEKRYEYIELNEFLMLHLIAHMAYHFIGGGCGLRSVLDIWILRHSLKIDDNVLNDLLENAELKKFYDTVVSLSEYWFGDLTNVSDTVLEAEKFILLGGVYGTKKQNALSKQVKSGGKFGYFIRRIFMPYESLAILYPVIKKYKILTPFCQILRWFGAIFKAKRIRKEIKNVSMTSEEQVLRLEILLKKLEI